MDGCYQTPSLDFGYHQIFDQATQKKEKDFRKKNLNKSNKKKTESAQIIDNLTTKKKTTNQKKEVNLHFLRGKKRRKVDEEKKNTF